MGKSRPSKYIHILGEQVAKRTVYLGIAVTLIVVGGVVGGLYYLLLQGSAPVAVTSAPVAVTSAPVESQVEVSVAVAPLTTPEIAAEPIIHDVQNQSEGEVSMAPLTLKVLLEKHLKATQLGELDALLVNGTAAAETVRCEVSLMARRPNLYKLKTEAVGAEYTSQYGYDGQQGWFRQDSVELDEVNVEFFMRVALFESSVAHLAWSYQSDESLELGLDAVLECLPDEQWQGRTCAVVMSRSILPFPIYHYLDRQSYEEVYRRAQVLKGTELVNLELHFAPSGSGSSPRLPMGYELYFDGVLHDTVTFTRVRANRVVLSSLFDAPSTASATGLSPRQ